MRFLAFLEGVSGVRGFQVATFDGELLAETGSPAGGGWTSPRVAAVAQDLAVAGALAGLGAFVGASVRLAKTSRLLAQSAEGFALVDIDPSCSTTEIEADSSTTEWVSKTEIPGRAPDVEIVVEEPETIRPPKAAVLRPAAAPRPPSVPRLQVATAPVAAVEGRPAAVPPPFVRPRPAAAVAPQVPVFGAVIPRGAGGAVPAVVPNVVSGERGSEVVPVAAKVAAPLQSPQFTGSLQHFSLPDLLEFLRVGQRTGTLVCASEVGFGTLVLRRGRIAAADTVGVPNLGDFLVQRGALSPAQLESAQKKQLATRAPSLSVVLQAQQLVSKEAVHETLMLHVVHVVRKLMTWDGGEFTFDPTAKVEPASEYDIDLDPQGVLLNIFKEMDDAQRA
ncbi:MAG: DUF4388 domain-containing protein [Polyangiaceae bacterium]